MCHYHHVLVKVIFSTCYCKTEYSQVLLQKTFSPTQLEQFPTKCNEPPVYMGPLRLLFSCNVSHLCSSRV